MTHFVEFSKIADERGSLVPVDLNKKLPFDCKRVYFLKNLDPQLRRGFHAHHALRQAFYCVQGSCVVMLDDGARKVDVAVSGEKALLIEPMIWHEMYDFSADCVIAVFASEHYLEKDYIRDRSTFQKLISGDK